MDSLFIRGPEGMGRVVRRVLAREQPPRVVALYGPMGAGKTTLVQAFCGALGVREAVTSPTFALVNEYEWREGRIYHLDLYRLRSEEEALQLGLEEILGAGAWCFVEWPALIEALLPPDHLAIKLELVDETTRKVIFLKS